MKSKGTRLAAVIIGSLVAVSLLTFGGFNMLGSFTRAAGSDPTEVLVTDITQNSATVTWNTANNVQGVVIYGTQATTLDLFAPEQAGTTTHSVDLTLLTPGTQYFFQIKVGDKIYANGGAPWTFTTRDVGASTGPTVAATPPPSPSSTPAPTSSTTKVQYCYETSCDAIRAKLGKGCTTQDYFLCIHKLTPTP